MAEKDKVHNGKIKQEGIFNFKDFYEFLYDYLTDQNYDVVELKYVEKLKGESKDIEIIWIATKEVSDYFKFDIRVHWLIYGMKKIKAKREGEELIMDNGTMELRFDAWLVKDWENRWENRPFWKFLRGVYDRFIVKSRVDDYGIKLWEESIEVINQAKSFLAVEGQSG